MKYSLVLMGILLIAPQSAPANTPAFAQCGTYDSYILLYKSIQKFEELGKLHCGESLVITGQDGDFTQVRTTDGRLGWVPSGDLSTTAPAPQTVYTFGWTQKPKPEAQLDSAVAQPTSQTPETAPLPTSVERPVGTPAQTAAGTIVEPAAQTPAETMVQPSVEPVVAPITQTPSEPAESGSAAAPVAAPVPAAGGAAGTSCRRATQRIRSAADECKRDENARRSHEPRRHHHAARCCALRFRHFPCRTASFEAIGSFRPHHSGDDARAGRLSRGPAGRSAFGRSKNSRSNAGATGGEQRCLFQRFTGRLRRRYGRRRTGEAERRHRDPQRSRSARANHGGEANGLGKFRTGGLVHAGRYRRHR